MYLSLLRGEGQLACTEQPLGLLTQALCKSSFAVHCFTFTLHLFIVIFTLLRMRVQYVDSTGYQHVVELEESLHPSFYHLPDVFAFDDLRRIMIGVNHCLSISAFIALFVCSFQNGDCNQTQQWVSQGCRVCNFFITHSSCPPASALAILENRARCD